MQLRLAEESMGLNRARLSRALFHAFVGDLLFIVSHVSHNEWSDGEKNSIAFDDGSMCA